MKTSDGVALVGQAAKLLNAGGEAGDALAAVVELLRTGLPADQVMVWFRDPQTSGFRAVSSPLEKKGSRPWWSRCRPFPATARGYGSRWSTKRR